MGVVLKHPTNSHILDTDPGNTGFVVGDNWEYAAIPLGLTKKMVVVYDNGKTKVCRNEQSARNFIEKKRKSRKK